MRPDYFVTVVLSSTLVFSSCADSQSEREIQELASLAYAQVEPEWDEQTWSDPAAAPEWAEPADPSWPEPEQPASPDSNEPDWAEPPAQPASDPWTDPNQPDWAEPPAQPESDPWTDPDQPDWAEPPAQPESDPWTDPDQPDWAEPPAQPDSDPWTDPNEPDWAEPPAQPDPMNDPTSTPPTEPSEPELDPIDPIIDTDGDSLPDWIEVNGYERDGRILDLPALGADPSRKDIFVEIDYMPGFRPSDAAIAMVKQAFASAPVDDGKGIALHVFVDKELTIAESKAEVDFDDISTLRNNNFDSLREIAFHWALFANKRAGTNSSGVAAIDGNWLVVSLGAAIWKDKTDLTVAGTFMHELGHNLGLYHAGTKNMSAFTPHYMSVMSYFYQTDGVPVGGGYVLDFARISVAELNEARLSEVEALSPGPGTTETALARYTNPWICLIQTGVPGSERCDAYTQLAGNLSKNLDFNQVNGVEQGFVAANLDGFAQHTTIPALDDDWSNLVYSGGGAIGNVSPQFPRRHIQLEELISCLDAPPGKQF